jgi:hypothetical protein
MLKTFKNIHKLMKSGRLQKVVKATFKKQKRKYGRKKKK